MIMNLIFLITILPGLVIAFQENGKYRMIFFSIAIGVNISNIVTELVK